MPLMKVIRRIVTRGVTAHPPLKETSSRDLWRRGHKKRWKMHWPRSKNDRGTVERRKTSRSPMPLFPSCVGDIVPCRIGSCFMTLLVWHFITQSSWSINLIGYSKRKKKLSQIPTSRTTSPISVRTPTQNHSSARSEMIFSWIIEQDGYTMSQLDHTNMALKRTTLSWVLDRHWQFASATRSPGSIHGCTHKATMIWLEDIREPRSTLFGRERYAGNT
jgi:hypothetical protein